MTASPSGASGSRTQTIAAVERAADVMLHVAQSPSTSLGVTEIATDLGMSKAVVHRILNSLRTRGLIEMNAETRRYQLGAMAVMLGLSSLNRFDLRQHVRPVLVDLARVTNETATMSVRTGNTRIYLDQVTPQREVIMSVSLGVAYPLHAGASSKALLAFLPDDEIDAYLHGSLSQLTDSTVTNVAVLRRELREIRERGWASSSQERQAGASAVAAPVLDRNNSPAAVISIGGPAERFEGVIESCTAHLLRAVKGLSQQLGYVPSHPGS